MVPTRIYNVLLQPSQTQEEIKRRVQSEAHNYFAQQVALQWAAVMGTDDKELVVESSPKIVFVMELVAAIVETGDRIIIFSERLQILDAVGVRLQASGVTTAVCTGQMKRGERDAVVKKFHPHHISDATPSVLLLSLQIGATGLNLAGANHAIFLHLGYNPATIAQAVARMTRPQQKKDVHAYNILLEGFDTQRDALHQQKAMVAEEYALDIGCSVCRQELEQELLPFGPLQRAVQLCPCRVFLAPSGAPVDPGQGRDDAESIIYSGELFSDISPTEDIERIEAAAHQAAELLCSDRLAAHLESAHLYLKSAHVFPRLFPGGHVQDLSESEAESPDVLPSASASSSTGPHTIIELDGAGAATPEGHKEAAAQPKRRAAARPKRRAAAHPKRRAAAQPKRRASAQPKRRFQTNTGIDGVYYSGKRQSSKKFAAGLQVNRKRKIIAWCTTKEEAEQELAAAKQRLLETGSV